MNNKKIQNPKTEVEATKEMNDKDYLNVALELEKNMSNNYSIALNEASNDQLYNDYFDMFENTKDAAREVYEVMFQNGWYSLEEEDSNKINQKIDEMTQQLKELPE